MSGELDPEAVAEAPLVTAVEGLMLEVSTDANGIEYMPALCFHLTSTVGDTWKQTMLVNLTMVERLRDNVLPGLTGYIDTHTEDP